MARAAVRQRARPTAPTGMASIPKRLKRSAGLSRSSFENRGRCCPGYSRSCAAGYPPGRSLPVAPFRLGLCLGDREPRADGQCGELIDCAAASTPVRKLPLRRDARAYAGAIGRLPAGSTAGKTPPALSRVAIRTRVRGSPAPFPNSFFSRVSPYRRRPRWRPHARKTGLPRREVPKDLFAADTCRNGSPDRPSQKGGLRTLERDRPNGASAPIPAVHVTRIRMGMDDRRASLRMPYLSLKPPVSQSRSRNRSRWPAILCHHARRRRRG
jgi:hypothetical protein